MKNLVIFLLILSLSGCSGFVQKNFVDPVYASPEIEQQECLENFFCKTFLDDRPAWVFRYSSQRNDCQEYSKEIVEQARKDGRPAGFAIGTRNDTLHAVALVDDGKGNVWVFDNGFLVQGGPFPMSELSHHMSNIWWASELPTNQTHYEQKFKENT